MGRQDRDRDRGFTTWGSGSAIGSWDSGALPAPPMPGDGYAGGGGGRRGPAPPAHPPPPMAPKRADDGTLTMTLWIPDEQVGHFIGKSGANVRRITEATRV